MLDRRKFLKIGASLSVGKTVEASKVILGVVKNGETITAAHWGN